MRQIGVLLSLGLSIVAGFYLLVFTALDGIMYGLALNFLWPWFIVPIFHLPELSQSAAIGIALTARFMFINLADIKVDDYEKKVDYNIILIRSIARSIVNPLLAV